MKGVIFLWSSRVSGSSFGEMQLYKKNTVSILKRILHTVLSIKEDLTYLGIIRRRRSRCSPPYIVEGDNFDSLSLNLASWDLSEEYNR